MPEFKDILKAFRLRAGFGLREFAERIGEHPSNYAGMESGQRKAPQAQRKLRRMADELALEEGGRDWDAFFIAAGRNSTLPPNMEHLLERPMIPLLLRTVDELQLSEDELRKLVEHLRKKHGAKGRASYRSSHLHAKRARA